MVEKRLFGTFGVRRTANDVLTPEFASRLAASYGSIVQGTVAIGGDTRTSTPMLKYAITAGLLSSGCDVVDLGILPTPAIQYAVRNYYDGGIIVTASHNPPKYNGLKFVDEFGIGTPDDMEIEVEKLYFDSEPNRASWDKIGECFTNDTIIKEYIAETIKRVDAEAIRNRKLKVVVDCGSGAGSYTAPYILKELGCEVTTINCQADGFFPGRDPEPIEPNLQDLIATVKNLLPDNEISYLDWSGLEKQKELFAFVKNMILFRKAHPVFRVNQYRHGKNKTGYPELSFHALKPWKLNWNEPTLTFAYLYAEEGEKTKTGANRFIYVMVNSHWEAHSYELPVIPAGLRWHTVADTYQGVAYAPGEEVLLEEDGKVEIKPRSVVILITA